MTALFMPDAVPMISLKIYFSCFCQEIVFGKTITMNFQHQQCVSYCIISKACYML